ncbi:flavin-dependent monooxygenase QhpG [Motiliproteus sp.]|uniref:flavin-dependent monooxygenase QhpG n=1 Tax=Motiliproteus sp. TaxID=1898955 RepID=UPI003BA8ABBC
MENQNPTASSVNIPSPSTLNTEIAVVGGGPAATIAAIGLQRLGYRVLVITQPRPFAALEGISKRVIDSFRQQGMQALVEALPPPSPRQVSWNGSTSAANVEVLVDRQQLDRLLLDELRQRQISVVEARAQQLVADGDGWRISLQGHPQHRRVRADFLIEARGRSAPSAGEERVKGPETLSLLHYWQGPAGQLRSAVESFEHGWAWMAMAADGRRYLQLTVDPRYCPLPAKSELASFCQQQLLQLEQSGPFVEGAEPTDRVQARTSGCVLRQQLMGRRWLCIGDAAMAADPLSGNGVFQAMSSGLAAPAVVNTLLRHPKSYSIAAEFYRRRIHGLFYRFARVGRDFYRMEQRWSDQPFWRDRCDWPDREPSHAEPVPGRWSIETLPVIDRDRIRTAEVLVTPDQPMGIWHYRGVELAPVMRELGHNPSLDGADQRLADALKLDPELARQLVSWIGSEGWY